jgi:hypothetical protein
VEPVFFEAQGRADFGQIDDEVGFCLVPEVRIFDSLVADLPPTLRLWRPGVLGKFGMCKAKSANIELCVICRSSLKSKI